jgi:hypothetical protein
VGGVVLRGATTATLKGIAQRLRMDTRDALLILGQTEGKEMIGGIIKNRAVYIPLKRY